MGDCMEHDVLKNIIDKDKQAILKLIDRSDRNETGDISSIWREAIQFLSFVKDFSIESLLNIRLHTGFITGVPWFKHAHQPYRFWSDEEKESLPIVKNYFRLVRDVPPEIWCSEPVSSPLIESVGVRYQGNLISDDLVRYQRCISNLYRIGVFDDRNYSNGHATIVEIGGGYGAVAHHISAISEADLKLTYFIVDLPEMLMWSYLYLKINNPDKKIFIYDPEESKGFLSSGGYTDYDFVLVSNLDAHDLKKLSKVDHLINLLSFQEMEESQVRNYLEVFSPILEGYFYSENFSKHWMNSELNVALSDIYSDYFDLFPESAQYGDKIIGANSEENSDKLWSLFTFACIKKERSFSGNEKLVTSNGVFFK